MRPAWICVLLAVWMCGCRDDVLTSIDAQLAVSPEEVAFGPVWVGHRASHLLRVENRARVGVSLQVRTAPPFSVSRDTLEVPGGASVELEVFVEARAPGRIDGVLELLHEDDGLEVGLSAEAQPSPACSVANPCIPEVFDPARGECVAAPLPEGASCVHPSSCVTNAQCVQGACVGAVIGCDDGNPCTQDGCDASGKCLHVEVDPSVACAPPGSPCKVAFCDPKTGCGITDALDGAPCGAADCVTANVCISGACQLVAVPEGASCGTSSPCQAKGTCQQQVCVAPDPTVLVPAWTYTPANDAQIVFEGVADTQQNVYWAECVEPFCDGPGCTTCTAVSATRDGFVRWRSPLHGGPHSSFDEVVHTQLLSGTSLLTLLGTHSVIAQRSSDGSFLWQRSVAADQGAVLFDPQVPASQRRFSFSSPGIDGAGRLVVPINAWRVTSTQSIHHGAMLVALDVTTGATVWTRVLSARDPSVFTDEKGATFVAFQEKAPEPPYPPSRVQALDAMGEAKWTAHTQHASMPAIANGTLILAGVEAIDANSTQELWTLGGISSTEAVIQGSSAWTLQWRPGAGAFDLDRRDLRSGVTAWTIQMPNTYWATDLNLTTTGDLLFLRTTGDFVAGHELVSVDSQGQIEWVCSMPPLLHHANVALLNGRIVLKTVGGGVSVSAYDVPGAQLATTGWVTRGGSLARTNTAQ